MIDGRLREILAEVIGETLKNSVLERHAYVDNMVRMRNDAIGQIKQAFKDEGYRICLKNGELSTHMTGQEWYERFEENLYKLRGAQLEPKPIDEIAFEAARKASLLDVGVEGS